MTCEDPPLARLGIDDEPLEPVSDHESLFRLPRALFQPAQVDDREEQDRESGADDQREQAARDDHATGQPVPHLEPPVRVPRGGEQMRTEVLGKARRFFAATAP